MTGAVGVGVITGEGVAAAVKVVAVVLVVAAIVWPACDEAAVVKTPVGSTGGVATAEPKTFEIVSGIPASPEA